MLEIRPLCSGVIAFLSGLKSHTFTVISAVFSPSQDVIINREKVYSPHANAGNCNVYKADNKTLCSSLRDTYWLSAIILYSSNAMK